MITPINLPFPPPARLRPIVVIGAGGIVRDAHLPAYRLAGFPVAAIHDLDSAKAKALADEFGVPRVSATLADAIRLAPAETIFDVAVPAPALAAVLEVLPDRAPVLIQKPFGENLEQACSLLALCRRKQLVAAVNFQLRFAPAVAIARKMIADGAIGHLHDMEIRVTVHTPWHLWTFLENTPRVEILYHSVHHVDLIRSFLGDPRGIHALTLKHPATPRLAATRSAMALDYGDSVRANVTVNHGHNFGTRHQESYVKWEGTHGAIKAQLGLLMNYPHGAADYLEYCTIDSAGAPGAWQPVPVEGSWYPHAFIGTMGSLMRFANGETTDLPTRVEDACRTMAVVEAAYQSSATGATPIPPT